MDRNQSSNKTKLVVASPVRVGAQIGALLRRPEERAPVGNGSRESLRSAGVSASKQVALAGRRQGKARQRARPTYEGPAVELALLKEVQ